MEHNETEKEESGQRTTRRQVIQQTLGAAGALGLGAFLARYAPATRARTDRIPVRFWHLWTAEWQLVIERIVARFNQSQSRYEVIPLSIPSSSADSKFLLAAVGGNPPDVMAAAPRSPPRWAGPGSTAP